MIGLVIRARGEQIVELNLERGSNRAESLEADRLARGGFDVDDGVAMNGGELRQVVLRKLPGRARFSNAVSNGDEIHAPQYA